MHEHVYSMYMYMYITQYDSTVNIGMAMDDPAL